MQKKPTKSIFKMTMQIYLMIFVFMPFWIAPLVILVALTATQYDGQEISLIQKVASFIPIAYAYLTMLANFIKIQVERIKKKKSKKITFGKIVKSHSSEALILLFLQIGSIIINNFSGHSFLIAVFLQIFYFVMSVQEYFYRKILKDAPMDHKFLSFGKRMLKQ